MTACTLTQARLKELLSYDPETGVFTRIMSIKRSAHARAGQILKPGKNGRVTVKLDGRTYSGHRLAWLYMHGDWPALELDHRSGIPGENRILNLRDVTHAVNMQNVKRARRHSKTGVLGVVIKMGAPYAQISINGRTRTLGRYESIEAAHEAYLKAKRELHPGNTL